MKTLRGVIVGLGLFLILQGSASRDGGRIEGRVSGPVNFVSAAAVVYALPADGRSLPPADTTAVMDQVEMTFVPHVLPIQRGTTVKFLNSDTVRHNVFTPSKAGDRFNLGTYPGGESRSHTFTRTGEVILLCNVHPEMEAYIYIVDSPFFATMEENGEYALSGLPPGAYEVRVWHPDGEAGPHEVTIEEGAVATVDLVIR